MGRPHYLPAAFPRSMAMGATSGSAGVPIEVANYAAITPSAYEDGALILTQNTDVLWVKRSTAGGTAYVHRAVIWESLLTPSSGEVFRGSGTETPTDQGWTEEIAGSGTITATGGTVTCTTTGGGDTARVNSDTAPSAWTVGAFDISSLSSSGIVTSLLLFRSTGGGNATWVGLENWNGSTWTFRTRGGGTVATALPVGTPIDVEIYYRDADDAVQVYINRAAQPLIDQVVTGPDSGTTAPASMLVAGPSSGAGTMVFSGLKVLA